MKLVAGNSNRPLAEAISSALGIGLTRASIRRFSDSEIFVEISRERARRRRVPDSIDVDTGQRQPDGALDLPRRPEARLGAAG